MDGEVRQLHPDNHSTSVLKWDKHPVTIYLSRVADSTRRSRQYRLEQLANWLSEGRHTALSFPWSDLEADDLVLLRRSLVEKYAPGTANNYLTICKGILKECWRAGLMPDAVYRRIADVPGVADEHPPPGRDVQVEELTAIFRRLGSEGDLIAVRDSAILATLYGTGMRRMELCSLGVVDYDPHETAFLVHGKGGRDRLAYAPDWTREPLSAWLSVRSSAPGALFTRLLWGRLHPDYPNLDPSSLWRIIRRRFSQAGLQRATTHDLRRTYIGDMFDAGVDIATIGRNVGQKTPEVTARYDRRGDRTLKRAANLIANPMQQ